MRLQPVKPDEQIWSDDIVAQCPGAYLRKSPAQYTLIVEEPFTKRHWSRRKVNFEMALEQANKILEQILEQKLVEAVNERESLREQLRQAYVLIEMLNEKLALLVRS